MKVGILTWFFADNYGARAHTYALRKVIATMGHECEFINFVPENALRVNLISNLNCEQPKRQPIHTAKCLLRCLRFAQARKLNPCGKRVRNAQELDAAGYDLVILGSDAVFNVHHPLFRPIYYGAGLHKTPCITYAPSCEYMKPDASLSEELAQGLRRTKALSVRDTHTRLLVEKATDRKAELVLDPAFLWDFRDISLPPKQGNYLLIYSFSDWPQYADPVRAFAKEKGMQIISIGRRSTWADRSFDAVSFRQWLGFFEKAAVVFTDSFHGLVFAIKNQKACLLTSREDKRDKICDLLVQFGLDSIRFYEGVSVAEYLLEQPVFEDVATRLDSLKSKSLDYLTRALHP